MSGAMTVARIAVAISGLWLAMYLALPDGLASLPAAWESSWRSGPAAAAGAIGLAVALFGAGFGLGALRFLALLRGAGLEGQVGTLARANFIGGFLNLVVPGGVAGDAYRLVDARRDSGQGSALLGLLTMERLLALSALGGLGLFALASLPNAALSGEQRTAILAACLAMASAPLAILHPRFRTLVDRGVGLIDPRVPRIAAPIRRALHALASLREQRELLAGAFALSLAMQALPIVVVYVLALPLETDVAWYWFAAVVPLVSLASLLPITIAGTGVREALYVALFGAVGMPREVALVLSLLTLGVAAFWGAVGALLFGAGRGKADPEV